MMTTVYIVSLLMVAAVYAVATTMLERSRRRATRMVDYLKEEMRHLNDCLDECLANKMDEQKELDDEVSWLRRELDTLRKQELLRKEQDETIVALYPHIFNRPSVIPKEHDASEVSVHPR